MRFVWICVGFALLFLGLLTGCSSGSNADVKPVIGQGSVAFSMVWPTGKALPAMTQSVRIEIAQGNALLKSRLCDYPEAGGTDSETFDNLPAVTLQYTATAYSQPQGSGSIIGHISGECVIDQDRTTLVSLDIPFDTTIIKVSVSAPLMQLRVKDMEPLTATATNAGGWAVPTTIDWTTSNDTVLTVDSTGHVTAVGVGSATITATDRTTHKFGYAAITVIQDTASVTVSILPANPFVAVGDTVQLTASAVDANDNPINSAAFYWYSMDTSVAKVSNDGTVTGLGTGQVGIKATEKTSLQYTIIFITVTPAP